MNKENQKYLEVFAKGVVANIHQLGLRERYRDKDILTNAVEVCMNEAIILAEGENTDDT